MKRNFIRNGVVVAVALALFGPVAAYAADDLQTLRSEIEALKKELTAPHGTR